MVEHRERYIVGDIRRTGLVNSYSKKRLYGGVRVVVILVERLVKKDRLVVNSAPRTRSSGILADCPRIEEYYKSLPSLRVLGI